MKKLILSIAVIATFLVQSCGSGTSEKEVLTPVDSTVVVDEPIMGDTVAVDGDSVVIDKSR